MRLTKSGFTIVELLIVIVVIAILAAISIVAYNGIQDRARASAASTAASQAARKLALYQVDNGTYPPTGSLASAGVSNSNGTYYQYTGSGSTYCLTASVSGTSYNVSNANQSPQAGACSGQVDGGIITNLAQNPSVESDLNGWSANYGASGAGTTTRETNGGRSGNAYARMVWTTASTSVWGGINFPNYSVQQGESLAASVWVRTSSPQTIQLYLRPNNWPTNSDVIGPNISVPTNVWTRLHTTQTSTPSGVTTYFPLTVRTGSGTWQVGDRLDHDALMIVKSQLQLEFADGNTADWTWNGTPNNSTSTGPAP